MSNAFLVFIVILFSISESVVAKVPETYTQKNIQYQSFSGSCPSKSSGLMALIVMKEFEKNNSLKDVKEKIIHDKLDEKFFLSDYRINFNPVRKTVKISLECPEPLAKVQIYKPNGEEHYSAILGENAKLYEPQYEILMKAEKKLTFNLPLLALTTEQLETNAPTILAEFIKQMKLGTRKKISEIILNKNSELTIVFGLSSKATSVFLGADYWDVKLTKLDKILSYVTKNNRFPTTINLVNAKKVVVKFSDKI
jgi:hypothetical protein